MRITYMRTTNVRLSQYVNRTVAVGTRFLFLAALLVVAQGDTSLQAQQYLSTLTGTVTDSSGAKLVKAEVTARNVTTNFLTKTLTNGSGGYSIPFLTPDTYDVTVMAPGFGTQARTALVLTAGANVEASFALKIGTVGQEVVVSSAGQQLDTLSANLATTLSTQEVTDTPSLGRNPFVFATLAAGVTTGAYMQSKASSFVVPFGGTAVQISVNGIGGHVRLTLDGIPDDPAERLSGANYTGFVPSPEAVQEVKTQTSLFDAQYGHASAVINTVLRTGSNQFHGAGYYIFQNTYLNANTSERVPNQHGALNASTPTPRANDQYSQPGFVLDGPIIIPKVYDGRNKTFFMVAYERIQSKSLVPFATTTLLPSAAQRTGDFSSLCTNFVNGVCAPGAGVQIYDPLTGDLAGNRTPFLGNIIPSGRISPVGAALVKYFPLPNSTTSGPVINYVSQNTTYPQKYFSVVTRIDHSFSDSNKLHGTFFKAILNQLQTNDGYPNPIGITGSDYTVYRNNEGGTLEDIMVISPTLVMDARVGVIYHPFGLVFKGLTFNLADIGINGTGLPYQSFPGTSFSDGYGGLQAGAGGQISMDGVLSAAFIVSKALRKNNLRFGVQFDVNRYNVQNPQSGLGTFGFNRQFTQKNSLSTAVGSDAGSGNPIASLLLGYPSNGNFSNNVSYALEQLYYAGFVQDDWRVSSKLTINAGFRWDYEAPFTERFNRLNTGFCSTCTNPLQSQVNGLTLKGGLTFADASNRHPYPRDLNTAQPRFGAAYQLNQNMVLRGGFAITYLNTLESPIGQGFSVGTNYVATLDGSHPANSFANPFPSGVTAPTGSSLGLATQVGQSISFPDPNHKQPKLTAYTLNIQTQFPANIVLQIAYVGQRASQLQITKAFNGLPAQYFNQGASGVSFLQQQVPNPLAGLIPGSSLNAATVQRQSLLVPYPEFGGINDTGLSIGSQVYNALQTSLVKRMSHRVSFQANFTWLKEMNRNLYLNSGQDSVDSLFRYQDPTPNLVGNLIGIYQLTSFSGRPKFVRAAFGGWQINGVLRAQNGSLVPTPSNVTLLQNPAIGNPTYGHYFNTCYLNAAGIPVVGPTACASTNSTPAFQQHLSYTLNNIGPNLPTIRQRVHPLLDTSIFKKFQLHEGSTFEIRGELYNVLNTPNFGGPSNGLGSANFGVVNQTQANDPRIIQLTARVNF